MAALQGIAIARIDVGVNSIGAGAHTKTKLIEALQNRPAIATMLNPIRTTWRKIKDCLLACVPRKKTNVEVPPPLGGTVRDASVAVLKGGVGAISIRR